MLVLMLTLTVELEEMMSAPPAFVVSFLVAVGVVAVVVVAAAVSDGAAWVVPTLLCHS